MNDLDELELEEREREAKRKLSKKFYNFAVSIQTQSERGNYPIEFDVPIDEYAFNGCPVKSVVKIRPTKNCLIGLSDFPFFVINLDDIEMVYFERVSLQTKNFDMAVVFKDFHTFKRISSIPRESIDLIKQYLNEIGVIYFEGLIPMHWGNVLQSIRDDFEAFLDDGGWQFLQDDKEEEDGGEGKESEDDSEFDDDSGSSSEEGSEASAFSDEDDEDYSSEVDDESDEGLSWDELEK